MYGLLRLQMTIPFNDFVSLAVSHCQLTLLMLYSDPLQISLGLSNPSLIHCSSGHGGDIAGMRFFAGYSPEEPPLVLCPDTG